MAAVPQNPLGTSDVDGQETREWMDALSAVIEIVRYTSLSTLLPSNIANNYDELIAIKLAPSLLQRTAVLLQRKGAYQSAAAKAFINLAHEVCNPN